MDRTAGLLLTALFLTPAFFGVTCHTSRAATAWSRPVNITKKDYDTQTDEKDTIAHYRKAGY